MFTQEIWTSKTQFTILLSTCTWSNILMNNFYMSIQVPSKSKTPFTGAYIACKWSVIFIDDLFMAHQVLLLKKTPSTLVTLKCFLQVETVFELLNMRSLSLFISGQFCTASCAVFISCAYRPLMTIKMRILFKFFIALRTSFLFPNTLPSNRIIL